ncbi:MAG: branched-chain amino acid transport system permease protein [Azoarcus sp.]|uniref:Amino acid/amide ABC transporter membrane protein 1, HAAT family n=1 Tax=Aromatoleum tolulyticum TaxID=34027 RepID=A0A1N6NEY0_9RHOO|nr:branched-chain amino acid ABC transporter permease [Aromatoleum tolulyticum]MCK9986788.1 branched-chain amino acid transport system permease protein [Azoarcus sp.]SIP90603.1 amino acid/amide ABC transporter membrane protein 1, HAAT family [Aromatoleum tolulyticum]
MEIFLQQIVNGLVVGSVYALVALGYTMVYGILGLINFAHGDLVMVGALTALQTMMFLMGVAPGMSPIAMLTLSLLVAVPVCMLLAFTMERLAYRPLRNAPRLAPLITAIGVSFLLQTLAMIIWGRNYHTFPQLISTTPIQPIEGVFITPIQITIIIVSALMMAGLVLLVTKTKLGRAMRATAENHRVAALMGVDTNMIIALTFVLGAALAAVAGVMFASNYGIAHYGMGFMPGLKAFTAAVLGGIGNLGGAMLGGIVLGLVESFGAGYIEQATFGFLNSSYQDIFAFIILGLVLIFKPTGLLGERVSDRA